MSTPSKVEQKTIAHQAFMACWKQNYYKNGVVENAQLDRVIAEVAQKNKIQLNPADFPKLRQGVETYKTNLGYVFGAFGTAFKNIAKGFGGGAK